MNFGSRSIYAACVVGAFALFAACGDATRNSGFEGPLADGGGGDGSADGPTFGDTNFASVEITPPDPVLEVMNGAIPPALAFVATGITVGGKRVPLSGAS